MRIKATVMKPGTIEKEIICNVCGQPVPKDHRGYFSDYLRIDKKWGYFSEFDGELHSFDICQGCYKAFVKNFAVEVEAEVNPDTL